MMSPGRLKNRTEKRREILPVRLDFHALFDWHPQYLPIRDNPFPFDVDALYSSCSTSRLSS